MTNRGTKRGWDSRTRGEPGSSCSSRRVEKLQFKSRRRSFRCKRQTKKGRGAGSGTPWLRVCGRMYGSRSSLRTGEIPAGKQASFQQPEEQRRLFTLHQHLLRPKSKQKARLLISLPTQGQASRTPLNPFISSLILLFTHDVSATCEL